MFPYLYFMEECFLKQNWTETLSIYMVSHCVILWFMSFKSFFFLLGYFFFFTSLYLEAYSLSFELMSTLNDIRCLSRNVSETVSRNIPTIFFQFGKLSATHVIIKLKLLKSQQKMWARMYLHILRFKRKILTRSIPHDWPEQTQQEIYCIASFCT